MNKPWLPLNGISHVDRTRDERNRLGRVADILVAAGRIRPVEGGLAVGRHIDRLCRAHWPTLRNLPLIDAAWVSKRRRSLGVRAAIEPMIKERLGVLYTPLERRV